MLKSFIASFLKEEDGQDMVEYCLLIAFVGLTAVATLNGIKGHITAIWNNVNTHMNSAQTASAQ